MNVLDRYRGALLGLAAGDALGTKVEFQRPGTFEPVTEIVGGGMFELEPGEWRPVPYAHEIEWKNDSPDVHRADADAGTSCEESLGQNSARGGEHLVISRLCD